MLSLRLPLEPTEKNQELLGNGLYDPLDMYCFLKVLTSADSKGASDNYLRCG